MNASGTRTVWRAAAATVAAVAALSMLAGCSFKGWSTKVEVTDAASEGGYTYLQVKNVGQRLVADESTVIANCDCDWRDLSQHVEVGKEYRLRWKSSGSGRDLHLDKIDVGEHAASQNDGSVDGE